MNRPFASTDDYLSLWHSDHQPQREIFQKHDRYESF